MRIERDTPDIDWRSVGIGATVQGIGLLGLYLLGVTVTSYAATPLLGGLVAGVTSRNHRNEWIDGMAAATLGSLLVLAAIDLGILFTPGTTLDFRLNLVLFTTGYGLALAIVFIPFFVVGGAFVASIAASIKRTVA